MIASPDEIQILFECCICCDYLTDVRETSCCHQLFCLACIQSWLKQSGSNCPRCLSTTLTEQALQTNVVIQHFIDNARFTCPNKLQGCPAKIPRSYLTQHKLSCPYSPDNLTNQREQKLSESRLKLREYSNTKISTREKDNALYDLGKAFYEAHSYDEARQCLKMIKGMQNVFNVKTLSAQIEQDDGQYDNALEIYTDVYLKAKSNPQRIELLLASGHIYLKKAKYTEAQDKFTRALNFLPHNDQSQKKAEILNGIGLLAKKSSNVCLFDFLFLIFIFYFKFQYDQAISNYHKALEIADTNSDLWSEIVANLAGSITSYVLNLRIVIITFYFFELIFRCLSKKRKL